MPAATAMAVPVVVYTLALAPLKLPPLHRHIVQALSLSLPALGRQVVHAFALPALALAPLLPAGLELLAPNVTVGLTLSSNVTWIGGRSYFQFGVSVPVRHKAAASSNALLSAHTIHLAYCVSCVLRCHVRATRMRYAFYILCITICDPWP